MERINKVHVKRAENLVRLPNVSWVASGYKVKDGKKTDTPALLIGVLRKLPMDEVKANHFAPIPPMIDGVPTDVIESHRIQAPPPVTASQYLKRKLKSVEDHQGRFRPKVPGGVSAIICNSSACTLTCWVWSRKLGEPVILQCYHCEAYAACPDQSVLQPSPYDGGSWPDDTIGTILAGDISNPTTDSSIARMKSLEFATKEIFELGEYSGTIKAQVGDRLIKSGRTTGVTQAEVTATNAIVTIQYPDGLKIKRDLILTGKMLEGGDSSSPAFLIRNGEQINKIAGQGFAGSDTESVFVKPENIIADPAIQPYDLDFDYSWEDGEPPPPPTPPPSEGEVEYSIDEGATWLKAPSIRVKPTEQDGNGNGDTNGNGDHGVPIQEVFIGIINKYQDNTADIVEIFFEFPINMQKLAAAFYYALRKSGKRRK